MAPGFLKDGPFPSELLPPDHNVIVATFQGTSIHLLKLQDKCTPLFIAVTLKGSCFIQYEVYIILPLLINKGWTSFASSLKNLYCSHMLINS